MKTNCSPALHFDSAQFYMHAEIILLDSHYSSEWIVSLIFAPFLLWLLSAHRKRGSRTLSDLLRLHS